MTGEARPSRRAVAVGLALGAGGVLPSLLTPHARARRTHGRRLTTLIPQRVGDWRRVTGGDIVDVAAAGEARVYDDVVQWNFAAPAGPPLMLAVAYGLAASRRATTHRPEGCYTAQGFSIFHDGAVPIALAPGHSVMGRCMLATRADRNETVLYWRRIGSAVVSGPATEAEAYLRSAWNGLAADGTLVRMSMIGGSFDAALATLATFARALVAAASPTARDLMLGAAGAMR